MPPRRARSPLFPYTTLFRSRRQLGAAGAVQAGGGEPHPLARREHATGVEKRHQLDLRSEEHTSELQSHSDLVCRLLLEKNNHTSCSSRALCCPSLRWSQMCG